MIELHLEKAVAARSAAREARSKAFILLNQTVDEEVEQAKQTEIEAPLDAIVEYKARMEVML